MSLAVINREGHVDAAENIVRVGLAVEESLGLVVTLEKCNDFLGIFKSFRSVK